FRLASVDGFEGKRLEQEEVAIFVVLKRNSFLVDVPAAASPLLQNKAALVDFQPHEPLGGATGIFIHLAKETSVFIDASALNEEPFLVCCHGVARYERCLSGGVFRNDTCFWTMLRVGWLILEWCLPTTRSWQSVLLRKAPEPPPPRRRSRSQSSRVRHLLITKNFLRMVWRVYWGRGLQ